MVKVLAQLVGAGHHLLLSDPLLQVVHLAVQPEQLQCIVQLGAALVCQVAQASVQFVHLADAHGDGLRLGMVLGDEGTGHLTQLAHRLAVVRHIGLQGLVLLHEVLGGELVLAPVLDHHVELLLAHPGLGLVGVEEELLDTLVDQEVLAPRLHQVLHK